MTGFSVAVDLGNPGQLFACCGLLEAADRLWRDRAFVTGHFAGDRFVVAAPGDADALIGWLLEARVDHVTAHVRTVRGSNTGRVEYAYAGSGDDPACLRWPDGSTWRLNSWSGEARDGGLRDRFGRTRIKTFAGQMKAPKVVAHLLDWLRRLYPVEGKPLFDLAQNNADAATFGFDARKGRGGLDLGFSPDAVGLSAQEFPAVELFAAIGLQGSRPAAAEHDLLFGLWDRPLPVELARAAAACAFAAPLRRRCRFRLLGRKERGGVAGAPNDQYKAFARAAVEPFNPEGDSDE